MKDLEIKYVEALANEYNKDLATGHIYPVDSIRNKYHRVDRGNGDVDGYLLGVHIKPSTKEAFDAQDTKKQNPIITETSKLRGRLLKKSKKIEELKKENKRLADLCNNTNSRCVHLERKNEEFYDENKRLNQVLGVANQQAALVLYENKYLIEKNSFLEKVTQDQAKKIKDLKAAYSTLY